MLILGVPKWKKPSQRVIRIDIRKKVIRTDIRREVRRRDKRVARKRGLCTKRCRKGTNKQASTNRHTKKHEQTSR